MGTRDIVLIAAELAARRAAAAAADPRSRSRRDSSRARRARGILGRARRRIDDQAAAQIVAGGIAASPARNRCVASSQSPYGRGTARSSTAPSRLRPRYGSGAGSMPSSASSVGAKIGLPGRTAAHANRASRPRSAPCPTSPDEQRHAIVQRPRRHRRRRCQSSAPARRRARSRHRDRRRRPARCRRADPSRASAALKSSSAVSKKRMVWR